MGLFKIVCVSLLAAVARTQELENCTVETSYFSVASTEDAASLAASLQCTNGVFTVQWAGDVFVRETIHVSNSTFLNITGAGPGAFVDGGNSTQLFVVNGDSWVHLSDITLINGAASNGGAFYVEQSSVSFSGSTSLIFNSAGVDGGAIYASSSNVSWGGDGIEFSMNSAGENGGAIHAVDGSSVSWDGDGNEFSSNSAGSNGGVIFANGSSTVSWYGDNTHFSNNSGDSGGAISAGVNSTVSWYGDCTQFVNNSVQVSGGAIFAADRSLVSWHGDGTQFTSNFANSSGGGAIDAISSEISWFGDNTEFISNSASHLLQDAAGSSQSGGAIYVRSSSISWHGNGTKFGYNSARGCGGVIYAFDSTILWHGNETQFGYNSAGGTGGAIFASFTEMSWFGDGAQFSYNVAAEGGALFASSTEVSWYGNGAQFSFNFASDGSGGAISATSSDISWFGDDTMFNSNSAFDGGGGAIFAHRSNIIWNGNKAQFTSNYASTDGGAIYALESTVSNSRVSEEMTDSGMYVYDEYASYAITYLSAEDKHEFNTGASSDTKTTFQDNLCAGNGGALYVETPPSFYLAHATIQNNSASTAGGAVALIEAGDEDASAVLSKCTFLGNVATESGGAVETVSGHQEFRSCDFDGNSADVGGAMRLGGSALLDECSFLSNIAYTRGVAVAVVGSAVINGSSFDGNQLSCAVGSYRDDTENEDAHARFETVCFDCPAWDECLGCNITRGNTTSTCEEPLVHTTADKDGLVLETLNIDAGFWRPTNKSETMRACFNPDACSGGITGSDTFCASAYRGPYCAVCATGHFPSLGHTCTRCSSSRRRGLLAATAIAALIAVLATVAAVNFLLSAELENGNIGIFHHRRILQAIPIQALKIIVVVWQILTQFTDAANATFPGVYNDFLSVIDVVNFDLGSVLAAGCFWSDFDFHDRLLVGTAGPLVVVGFLAMTYTIAVHRSGKSGCTAVVLAKIRHKHQAALLLLTFLVYSSTSSTVFQTFACETLEDGIEYLRADYRIHCTDAKHKAFEVYAGIMVFIYPFGIPLLYAFLLYQHRHVLADSGTDKSGARSISGLWEPYKPGRFYYEVIECVRRVMLTGVVVFIYPNDAAQIAITILNVFFFFAIFDMLSPYDSESDMWLSRGGHMIVFLSMFYLLLLKVDVSSESDQSQNIFAGVLVAGHVLMILTILVEVIGVCFASRKKRDDEVAPESLDLRFEDACGNG